MAIKDEDRRHFTSFGELFQARQMPVANRDFVAHAFDNIEITAMIEMQEYVKVQRADGNRDLWIFSTIISGYVSEAEALEHTGTKKAMPSDSRPGLWWVWLPERTAPTVGGSPRPRAKVSQPSWMRRPCPKCDNLMNEAGKCMVCV